MKILLASPERDLLECYKALLETDGHETVAAFDGTQVLSLLSSDSFDAAVLDADLPRIDQKRLVSKLHDNKIPVIALTNEPAGTRQNKNSPEADAYLPYPFDYGKIKAVIIDTVKDSGKEINENE